MAGRIIVVVLCLLAMLFSIPAVSPHGAANWVSLAASSTAFVMMAINQFLATRPRLFEGLFGGLDRIYHFHRQLGMWALVLILVHYFVEPDFRGVQLTAGLNEIAEEAGEVAFYGLVGLIVLSLVKRIPFVNFEIPYHWWRQTHRLMGVFFIFVAFHFLFIKRPFGGEALLVNYLTFFAVIGIASFAWTQVMPRLKRRGFEVTAVDRTPGATIIEAKPSGGGLRAKPGQFGFLRGARVGMTEPHPFTLAGLRPGGVVRFAIKPLGDFTRHLREQIAVGDKLQIEGGYGRFNPLRGGDKQVWLAGGIGITPFLAVAASLGADNKRQIHLVHAVAKQEEAVDIALLEETVKTVPGFSFALHCSAEAGRLDAEKLAQGAPFDINGADLWFCGPTGLRDAIVGGMKKSGKRFRRVEFERFEFR